jgi:PAS domain S-box-containing protein
MMSGGMTNPILESALDAVVGMDRFGRITGFSLAAEKMFGHSREEVMGKLLAEVIVPPGLRPAHREILERYLAMGESHVLGKRVELSALRRDGTTFPVELAITWADSGPAQTFTGFFRDVSERKESEHFRLLVEAVKDYAIFMLDSEGRVVTWNPGAQAFNGYVAGEILGQSFSVFYSPEDRARGKPEGDLQAASETGRLEDTGWRVRKDGTLFWANVIIAAIRDGSGKLVGFAKVTRDLTEQRKAERLEELEVAQKSQALEQENRRMHEANRLKSEFLANMSHELRTPLNAIIGFAELMFKGKVGPVSGDHKEYLGDILNSSRHLLELINGVLDLAKVESGKMEFRPELLDLRKVLDEIRDILRGFASAKRIRIETRVDPAAASAVLDASKLKQVLYNYLSNALKFTPEGGLVTMRTVPEEGGRVRIEVQDTGIGIRREDVHRLFVEFQQLDTGTAKKYAGTGLGLALTKRIVEAQGGGVGVSSEPGAGSTFWAVLPRDADGVSSTSEPPSLPTPAAMAKTVLVIDDDPAALRLMRATLKGIGYSALCFAGSAEALLAMKTLSPVAMVLDLLMPEIDGYEVLARLRSLPHLRTVPVVIWTVQDLSEVERKHLLGSAQRIVMKGYGRGEAILDALRPYLGELLPGETHAG